MKISSWIVLILLFVIDRILKRTCYKVWKTLRLPINILCSTISLFMMFVTLKLEYNVIVSNADMGDKVFFSILMLAIIAIFVWANISIWKEWKKLHTKQK